MTEPNSKMELDLSNNRWEVYWTQDNMTPEDFARRRANLPKLKGTLPLQYPRIMAQNQREPDPYIGMNYRQFLKYESHYFWLRTVFDIPSKVWQNYSRNPQKTRCKLVLEGLDTIAKVFLNGQLIGEGNNYFYPLEVDASGVVQDEQNELLVEICPLPPDKQDVFGHGGSLGQRKNPRNLKGWQVRKPQHMFGWDIFPRLLGGGITGRVILFFLPRISVRRAFVETNTIREGEAHLRLGVELDGDAAGEEPLVARISIQALDLEVAETQGSSFQEEKIPLTFEGSSTLGFGHFTMPDPRLWYPKPLGTPELYELTGILSRGDEEVDGFQTRFGIHTIAVEESPRGGDGMFFRFIINGKPVFILGTNWVPLDALHIPPPGRLDEAITMVKELGCNLIRLWGGGAYESDEFYAECDKQGILVWQDFMMACGRYEPTPEFLRTLEPEIRNVTRRLRGHPALAIFCGDNENERDIIGDGGGIPRKPPAKSNFNNIGRTFIPRILKDEKVVHAYIPSSPYNPLDPFRPSDPFAGNAHLWFHGWSFRDSRYFGVIPSFISEIGHLGLPHIESLQQFLSEEVIPDWEEEEWAVHFGDVEEHHAYRSRQYLLRQAIERYFGELPKDLGQYILASQYTQAEAFKYWIEMSRIHQELCGGIIWWNLLDGWPQCSDALVDYYLRKKMGFQVVNLAQQKIIPIILCPHTTTSNGHEANPEYGLWVVNNSQHAFSGTIHLIKINAAQKESKQLIQFEIMPTTSKYIKKFQMGEKSCTKGFAMHLEIKSDDEIPVSLGKNYAIIPGNDFSYGLYHALFLRIIVLLDLVV